MKSNHWNEVYSKKAEKEVSWFQEFPRQSMELIQGLKLSADASIIDVGCGESRLIDSLMDKGFTNLSALDISEISITKLKTRLDLKSSNPIEYIVSDITNFIPSKKYHLWHDRAAFHFLTSASDVERYLQIANDSIESDGYLIISTFSKNGPEKCSGLEITKYSENDLANLFARYFTKLKCFEDVHITPWDSKQSFVYCLFQKNK